MAWKERELDRSTWVGFLGVGAMGGPMAANILKSGFSLDIYDPNAEAATAMGELGANICSSPRMVGSRSEVVLSMLPDSAALAASVLGRDGLAEGLSPGSTLVEMSTTDIDIVIRIDEALSAKKCAILDAPVSGTPDMVAGRDLTMMVGGDMATYRRLSSLLQALAKNVFHVGGVGAGRVCKFTNNMLVTMNLLSTMEIFAWAEKMEVNLEALFEVIRHSMGSSRIFEYHVPYMLQGDKTYQKRHIWLHKDLHLLLESADNKQVALPLTSQAGQVLAAARSLSGGQENMESILEYFKGVSGLGTGEKNPDTPGREAK